MSGFVRFLVFILTVLISTFLLYWLWNHVLVRALTIVNPIGFWEALGIAILTRLLIGPSIVKEETIVAAVPASMMTKTRRSSRRRRSSGRR